MRRIRIIGLLLAAATLAVAAGAAAQSRGRSTTIDLGDEKVFGSIDKPEAFYILNPASLTYQSAAPEASFMEQLYKTVEQPPL